MVEPVSVPSWLEDAKVAVLRDCPQLSPDDLNIAWDPSVLARLVDRVEPGDPRCFVLSVGGGWVTLPVQQGSVAVTTAIASAVQDHIVDETQRPWPELVDSGGRSVVLDVRSEDGVAWWVGTGFQRTAVGDLVASARRQSLTVLGQ